MPIPLFPRFLVTHLVLLAGLSAGLHAQQTTELTGKRKDTTATLARSRYYNLRSAGVQGFGCEVDVDWGTLFTSIAGKPLPADDPTLKYLQSSRLRFTTDLSGKHQIDWDATGVPPEATEKGVDQMRNGLKQMLSGFLLSWTQFLNGSIVPLTDTTLTQTPTGYTLVERRSTNKLVSTVTLDKDLLIKHMSVLSDTIHVESEPTFAASPSGLLLSQLDSVSRQPPTSPAANLVMAATYAPIDNYQIPATLTITLTNVLSFPMKFTGCTVQKAAVPAP